MLQPTSMMTPSKGTGKRSVSWRESLERYGVLPSLTAEAIAGRSHCALGTERMKLLLPEGEICVAWSRFTVTMGITGSWTVH